MSRREDIDNAVWSDPDFVSLTPTAKLAYLWSFTNPRCGMAGLYKISLPVAASEINVTADDLEVAFDELGDTGFAFHEAGVLWVRTRVRHLRSKSGTIAVAVARDVERIAPAHPLRVRFLEMYANDSWCHAELADCTRNSQIVGSSMGARAVLHDPSAINGVEPQEDDPTSTPGAPLVGVPGRGKGKGKGGSGGNEDPDVVPDDLPSELRPTLDAVLPILRRIAAAREANLVTATAAARAMIDMPRRPHLEAAQDLEYWLLHGTGRNNRPKDVVGYWRNQLKRKQDVQGSVPGAVVGRHETQLEVADRLAAKTARMLAERESA